MLRATVRQRPPHQPTAPSTPPPPPTGTTTTTTTIQASISFIVRRLLSYSLYIHKQKGTKVYVYSIRRHFQQWQSPGFLKPVGPWIWGRFLNNYQFGDPDLSAMPCYEELNPAPIPPEHVYSHITIPQLMKIYPSLDGYQEKPPLAAEHVAALRSRAWSASKPPRSAPRRRSPPRSRTALSQIDKPTPHHTPGPLKLLGWFQ